MINKDKDTIQSKNTLRDFKIDIINERKIDVEEDLFFPVSSFSRATTITLKKLGAEGSKTGENANRLTRL